MKIERQIGPKLSRRFRPRAKTARRTEPAKIASGKKMNMIDRGISPQQRGKLGINHPGDVGLRISVADKRDRGQGVHDVA